MFVEGYSARIKITIYLRDATPSRLCLGPPRLTVLALLMTFTGVQRAEADRTRLLISTSYPAEVRRDRGGHTGLDFWISPAGQPADGQRCRACHVGSRAARLEEPPPDGQVDDRVAEPEFEAALRASPELFANAFTAPTVESTLDRSTRPF